MDDRKSLKRARSGLAGLHVLEWIALLIIAAVLAYSAYRVKGQDLRDIGKFVRGETRALEDRLATPR